MIHLPSITALRCLDASARLLSFTRAAAEVNLTQSAVSHHISVLERELGTALFERDRSGLRLTPVGKRYWDDTAPILHQLQQAVTRATSADTGMRFLNVAVASTFANFWLMPRLNGFREQEPKIVLSLTNRAHAQGSLQEGEDAAIELCDGATGGFEARRILSLVYRPYVSAALAREFGIDGSHTVGHSRDNLVELLRVQPLIRTSMPNAWRAWLMKAGLENEVPARWLEISPFYAQASLALTAALKGAGIALLPQYIAGCAVNAGQLVCISSIGWNADRAYYLRWPARRPVNPAFLSFRDWLSRQEECE